MAQRRGAAGAGGGGSGAPDRLLSVPEVAERLRVSPETIRRYLRDGRLKGIKVGGVTSPYRISEAEVRRIERGAGAEDGGKGEGLAA
jgi:excisionase family DNA binding protein